MEIPKASANDLLSQLLHSIDAAPNTNSQTASSIPNAADVVVIDDPIERLGEFRPRDSDLRFFESRQTPDGEKYESYIRVRTHFVVVEVWSERGYCGQQWFATHASMNPHMAFPRGNTPAEVMLRHAVRSLIDLRWPIQRTDAEHDLLIETSSPDDAIFGLHSYNDIYFKSPQAKEAQAMVDVKKAIPVTVGAGGAGGAGSAGHAPVSAKSGLFKNVTVQESDDEQIHLPPGMSLPEAKEWLSQIQENEEQTIQWTAEIDAYPLDGAVALRRVLERRYGTAVKSGATVQTFFGEQEVPPYMVSVEVGLNEVDYVPWGYFIVPSMAEKQVQSTPGAGDKPKEQRIKTEVKEKTGGQLFFVLSGEIKRKNKAIMDAIAEEIREEVRANSIYRGKSFRLAFPETIFDNPNDFAPKFIATAGPNDNLILPEDTETQIQTSVFTPVEHSETCRRAGIPLKRGVLLAGKYGVGKTLTAAILSRKANANGWTFIYLEKVTDFAKAMLFAKRYEPAIIFAEDIDSVINDEADRSEEVNAILNTLDGVDTKGSEIMTILTTNFIEDIDQAMLRPGRLDAVVVVEPPDAKAVLRLIRHYSRGMLDQETDENLAEVCELLAGNIPAIVRETVERSKLSAIARTKSSSFGPALRVTATDLLNAAKGMVTHLKLLAEKPNDSRSNAEKAADRFGAWTILNKNGSDEQAVDIARRVISGEDVQLALDEFSRVSRARSKR